MGRPETARQIGRQEMKLHEVLKRATEDPDFARELREKASRAKEEGPDSDAHIEFLTIFVTVPEDLELLKEPHVSTTIVEMSGLTSHRAFC
jgi:hypothetical protein